MRRIFGPESTQEDVDTFISSIVKNSPLGISSTVLAYGKNQSEKNYTILGSPVNPGLLFKFLEDLFLKISAYTVTLQYFPSALRENL